jgi:hypothetical protein
VTLSQQRRLFTLLLARLVVWVNDNLPGHSLAFDQVKRDPATAQANAKAGAGIANSLHLDALAADMLLYIDGMYTADTEAHRKIGEQWERMHPLNRWGGRWGDGNHYSSTRGGIK